MEDDEVFREAIRNALQDEDFRIVLTDGPSPARAATRGESADWDLLIADVILPETTGLELHRELRRYQPGLKVLFMSGYTRRLLVARGYLKEEDLFLEKPFSRRDLLEAIGQALARPVPHAPR